MTCDEVTAIIRTKDPRDATTAERTAVNKHMKECAACSDLMLARASTFATVFPKLAAEILKEAGPEIRSLVEKDSRDPESV